MEARIASWKIYAQIVEFHEDFAVAGGVQLISAAFMVCTAHCETPHFPKHKFPVHVTRNVLTQ